MVKYNLTNREINSVKRILVIQTAFIGDVILSTTIFKGIKNIFPDAKLDVLLIPQTSILLKDNKLINEIIEFDKREIQNRIGSIFTVVKKIKENKYDLAISIQSSLTSSLLMLLGKIPIRIGYPRQKLITHTIDLEKGLHIRKRVLQLLKPLSENSFDDQTELFYGEQEEFRVDKILNKIPNKKIIALAPGSAQYTKQWPKEYFGELINLIEEEGFDTVLIGGPEDKFVCNEIKSKYNLDAVNLAGELSLLESAVLIKKIDLVISNDSAPLHIANAVKTDVIAIFGPTVKKFGCYPYRDGDKILEVELDCRPCSKHGGDSCPKEHFKCMKNIKPKMVFEVVKNKFGIK